MPEGELRTKVMQEVHDVSMVGHCGEKTTRELLGKKFILVRNEGRCKTSCPHMCEVPKY